MAQQRIDNKCQRDAWVRQRLAELAPGLSILDAGAGKQPYRPDCTHLRYEAQDFGDYDGGGDGRGLQVGDNWHYEGLDLRCDITAVPRPDASYDVILCTEVIEHVPDPAAALAEFARLLRPGGQLLLTAPFCSLTHYSPYHYSTGFSRYFYEHHLDRLGFDVVEMTPNGGYFDYLAQEVARLPSVAHRFTGDGAGRIDRWAIRWLLRRLTRWAAKESDADGRPASSQLLAFGWHVRAVRRAEAVSHAA